MKLIKIFLATLVCDFTFAHFVFTDDNLKLKNECETENFDSCFRLAENLSALCLNKQDFDIGAEAVKYYEKSCNAKIQPACFMVAFMHSTGQCVPQNIKLAQKYAKISCDEERQSAACALYARSEYLSEQEKQKYLQKACEYNEWWCHKVNK